MEGISSIGSIRRFLQAFLILLARVDVSEQTACGKLTYTFFAAGNRVLQNSVVWSRVINTSGTCVSICHSVPECLSVNYNHNTRICELNDATRSDFPDQLTTQFASVYYDDNEDTLSFNYEFYSTQPDTVSPVIEVTTSTDPEAVSPSLEVPTSTDQDWQGCSSKEIDESGVYKIYLPGRPEGIEVYCDDDTDNGGWIVIQRREDGSENFVRNWTDYQRGFGSLTGEFWLGNDIIAQLTGSNTTWTLRIDMEDWEGAAAWAEYSGFSLTGDHYTLNVDQYNESSTAGNSLYVHENAGFSTFNRDNDFTPTVLCSQSYGSGGWWFKFCLSDESNLNGRYMPSKKDTASVGIKWISWKGTKYSLKKCSMKMREGSDLQL